jgi:anti-anti-sigma regulatory factor
LTSSLPRPGIRSSVLRFEGDIASTSKDAVLGTYQALPKETSKLVLLDFTKVDYINSSGIALVIQMMIEASNSGRRSMPSGFRRTLPRSSPWWASPSTPGC